jgi:plastocyanin
MTAISAAALLCSISLCVACGSAPTSDPTIEARSTGHVPDLHNPSASAARDDAPATNAATRDTPGEAPPAPPRPTGIVHLVQVTDTGFSPLSLSLSLGDSVDFVFTASDHSVTSGFECHADGMFQSGRQGSGTTYRVTFLRTGVFPFFSDDACDTMTGALLVKN